MRLALPILVVAFVALVAVPRTAAAISLRPCNEETVVQCGAVKVPLDPSRAVPGSVRIALARLRPRRPNGTAVFAFAGGPGQGATGFEADFALELGPALKRRDLVVMDQRGTGESDAIACPELDRVVDPARGAAAVHACARRLGRGASFYSTAETVADIDAVRAALGYDRISLYGVSYGTKVALAYAAAHPDRVERLVLDSIVQPDGPDPLLRDSFAATPRVLRELCQGGACRGETTDPVGDLSTLVKRISARPLQGFVYSPGGRRVAATLDPSGLYRLFVSGDMEPVLRAAFPAAVRSAVEGDPAALLRLAAKIAPPSDPGTVDPREFSNGLWLATVCSELPFPWAPTAPEAERRLQAEQLAASLGSAFGPFSARAALDYDLVHLCEHWPVRVAPRSPSDLSVVRSPVLLLAGRDDVRTPLEGARRVARQLATADVVSVVDTGHSVVSADVSGCARDAAVGFLNGVRPSAPACPRRWKREAIVPKQPRTLQDLIPAGGGAGRPGRTLRAVMVTLDDVTRELFTFWLDEGGLRGGHFFLDEGILVLDRVAVVPGVRVSGRMDPYEGTGRLRVSGPTASGGTLVLSAGGGIEGVLGGTRVRSRRVAGR